MKRPTANPFYSGLVAAIVLVVLMIGVVVSGIPGGPQVPLPWNKKVALHVQLANADALAPHASVEIGGVKIGEVQNVVAEKNLALATLEIQSQYSDIHNDATVFLRAHGLFGPKYIAIVPGSGSAPVLRDGDTINVGRTVQPVDLDAILQDLQAPEQQKLRTTIVELGKAAAGQGDEVNHLFAAADSLTQVLDSPLVAVGRVSPQLNSMIINNESFNATFAQAPLDQLIANSEASIKVFADNAAALQSLLSHANITLAQLEPALNGEAGNIDRIIAMLGDPQNGTIVKLNKFTYLLGLFGANLTGKDPTVGSSAQDVTGGIIGAIENVRSAFVAGDPCPANSVNNHCAVSPDGLQHYLHVRVFNFPPSILPNLPPLPGLPPICLPVIFPGLPQICLPLPATAQSGAGAPLLTGNDMRSFGALLAS